VADANQYELDNLNRGAGAYSTPGVDPAFVPTDFVPRTATPQVQFQLHNIAPPSGVYLAPEDSLRLRGWTGTTGLTIAAILRWMRPDGLIIPLRYELPVTSNRVTTQLVIALGEGYLLSAQIGIITQGAGATQTFAALYLERAGSGAAGFVQVLCSGTIRLNGSITYPGGRTDLPTDGRGYMISVQQANPGAGADWTMTVPTNARWRLNSLNAQFVTAVAVATRIPAFIIDDGANVLFEVEPVVGELAASTEQYSLCPGGGSQDGANVSSVLPLPGDFFLHAGWRIRTSTAAIQAADQWSNIWAGVEEWIDQG
jgi:hypothetical protein